MLEAEFQQLELEETQYLAQLLGRLPSAQELSEFRAALIPLGEAIAAYLVRDNE